MIQPVDIAGAKTKLKGWHTILQRKIYVRLAYLGWTRREFALRLGVTGGNVIEMMTGLVYPVVGPRKQDDVQYADPRYHRRVRPIDPKWVDRFEIILGLPYGALDDDEPYGVLVEPPQFGKWAPPEGVKA